MNPKSVDVDIDTELLEMLAEAEAKVAALRAELHRRQEMRAQKLAHGEVLPHHTAPDESTARFADLLESARISWEDVLGFLRAAVAEQRSGHHWGDETDTVDSDGASPKHDDTDDTAT